MQDEERNDNAGERVQRREGQDTSIHQHLGRLEGRMDGLEERQTRFEMRTDSSLNEMNGKLDQLLTASVKNNAEKTVSWKIVTTAGSIIVFLVGVIGWGVNQYLDLKNDVYPIRTQEDISKQIEKETDDEDAE